MTVKDKVIALSANTALGAHNVVFATIGAGGITLTLPSAASTTVGSYRIIIADTGVGNLTLAPNGTDKINGINSSVTKTGQYTGLEALWISTTDGWFVRQLVVSVSGGGNVSNAGTPTGGQAAEWSNATTILGVPVTGTGSYAKGTAPTITNGFFSATNAQTGTTYTILASDNQKLITFNNAASIAVTLPQATTSGFTAGAVFHLRNLGVGTVTVTPTTSTIDGAATLVLPTKSAVDIYSDGTNYATHSGFPNPMTTAGDLLYGGTNGIPTRVPFGTGLFRGNGASSPSFAELSGDCVTNGSNAVTCDPLITTLSTSTTYTCPWNTARDCEMSMTGTAGTVNFAPPSGGTPPNGRRLWTRIKCTNTQVITTDTIFIPSPNIPLPTQCLGGTAGWIGYGWVYSTVLSKWQLWAVN
jgi:hypothetical protein